MNLQLLTEILLIKYDVTKLNVILKIYSEMKSSPLYTVWFNPKSVNDYRHFVLVYINSHFCTNAYKMKKQKRPMIVFLCIFK